MPQLLREIKKALWLPQRDGDPLPASALRDMLLDQEGRLSVYLLPDAPEYNAELSRTIVALTLKSGHCEKFEFAIVDTSAIDDLGIALLSTPGTTADAVVNAAHRDIEDPGVAKLAALTLRFVPQDAVRAGEVSKLIADAVNLGQLQRNALPEAIIRKLINGNYLSGEPSDSS